MGRFSVLPSPVRARDFNLRMQVADKGKDRHNRPQYDRQVIVLSSRTFRSIHFRYAWGRNPMGNLQAAGNKIYLSQLNAVVIGKLRMFLLNLWSRKYVPKDYARRAKNESQSFTLG